MIMKRGNSWWVVVYTGRDPLTGKKRQKTGTAKTRAGARQLEAQLIRRQGPASPGPPATRRWPSCWAPGANGDPVRARSPSAPCLASAA